MKNIFKYTMQSLALLFLLAGLTFIYSCEEDEENSNVIQLNSFGPSPALRGGELMFIGRNLDQVTAIVLPDNVEITNFKTKTSTMVVIDVPEETLDGFVVLKTPQGDITTKSRLGISEPISISSISPESVRPGDSITISGDYLNLIKGVVFTINKAVGDTAFGVHTKTTIKVRVPADAETGPVVLSNGEEIPILVQSEDDLEVILPMATELAPGTIKAGANLTITGTNLDLTAEVVFPGFSRVAAEDFVSVSQTTLVVPVPDDSQDGKVTLVAASSLTTESTGSITMVVPTITGMTPNPTKLGDQITITGTNLDLVTSAVFEGESEGDIDSQSETELVVTVPATALEGAVVLNTASGKSVSSSALNLVSPTITSITPTTVETINDPVITITGTDLDKIAKVVFGDDWEVEVNGSETEIVVNVVPGSITGPVKVVATNGEIITSAQTLTIVPDVPDITTYPEEAFVKEMLVLEGTRLDVTADIYLPGDIKATRFGEKSATKIEIYVPADVLLGEGVVKFVTAKNEIYESPTIQFKAVNPPDLIVPLYADALVAGTGAGGGWGESVTDWANTEEVREGSNAIKVTYTTSWSGGAQIGTWGNDPVSIPGTTFFAFSMIGVGDAAGKNIQIVVKDGNGEYSTQVQIPSGDWGDIAIPLSDLGDITECTELFFQNTDQWTGTVYIDYIGFR